MQPSDLCQRHLQRRDLPLHGNAAAGAEGTQPENRTIGLLDNGTWAATAGNQMRTVLESMQNMTILEPVIHIKSALTEAQLPELDALADAVAASL